MRFLLPTAKAGGFQKRYFSMINNDGLVYSDDSYTKLMGYSGTVRETYNLHPNTKIIAPNTFKNTAVQKIVCPEGLLEIRHSAFAESALREIVFNKNLRLIGMRAFANTSLKNIDLSASKNVVLDKGAFTDNICLETFKVNSNIGPNCCFNCHGLNTVILGDNCKTVASAAFSYCSNIHHINLDKVEMIGSKAFRHSALICDLNFDSLCVLHKHAFSASKFHTLHIPVNLFKLLEQHTFDDCSFVNLKIEEGAQEIQNFWFLNNRIHTLTLPSSLKLIDEDAFFGAHIKNIYYNGTREEFDKINKLESHSMRLSKCNFVTRPSIDELLDSGKTLAEIDKIQKDFSKNYNSGKEHGIR